MAFIPNNERERVREFLKSGGAKDEDLMLKFMASVYSESRQTERLECQREAQRVMDNALKWRQGEISETGMEFQRGRRTAAEEIMAAIQSRRLLLLEQDSMYPDETPVADEPLPVAETGLESTTQYAAPLDTFVTLPSSIEDEDLPEEADADDVVIIEGTVTERQDEVFDFSPQIVPQPEIERPAKKRATARKKVTNDRTRQRKKR